MPYYSINESTSHRWYWFLHEARGHEYHMSVGYNTFNQCVDALKANGPLILKQYYDLKR